MYRLCDVALITPLRDGMNLVAKEFVASRPDQTGVLILSEMAGAAKEMGEAMIINPFHSGDFAQALEQALAMPAEEQVRRNQLLQERLRRYDVIRWAEDFIASPAGHAKDRGGAAGAGADGQGAGGAGPAISRGSPAGVAAGLRRHAGAVCGGPQAGAAGRGTAGSAGRAGRRTPAMRW